MQLTAMTAKNPFQSDRRNNISHMHSPSYSSVGSYSTAVNSNRNPNKSKMLMTQIEF